MKHKTDKLCRCKHCLMIDIMFGDPYLTDWEKTFVEDVGRQGWYRDYSDKQKAKIESIFTIMKKMRKKGEQRN